MDGLFLFLFAYFDLMENQIDYVLKEVEVYMTNAFSTSKPVKQTAMVLLWFKWMSDLLNAVDDPQESKNYGNHFQSTVKMFRGPYQYILTIKKNMEGSVGSTGKLAQLEKMMDVFLSKPSVLYPDGPFPEGIKEVLEHVSNVTGTFVKSEAAMQNILDRFSADDIDINF